MSIIYRPCTGSIKNDMRQCRIFNSFEEMREELAKERELPINAIVDGTYVDPKDECLNTGFKSSKYISAYSLSPEFVDYKHQSPIRFGLYSSTWDQYIVDEWMKVSNEGIIYRPHRGALDRSMKEVMYFESFDELRNYIIDSYKGWMKLNPIEIIPEGKPTKDERIGWLDSDYVLLESYDNVEDKHGHKAYFGTKVTNPVCIGMFATLWNKDQPNGIKKNTPITLT